MEKPDRPTDKIFHARSVQSCYFLFVKLRFDGCFASGKNNNQRYYMELCWPVIELRPTIKRRVEGVKDVLSYFARVISGWKELLSLSKFIDKNGIDIIWDKHFRTCYSPPVFYFPARYSPLLLCNMDAITMETARLPAIDLNNRGQAEWERWLAQALGPWIWQTWSNKGTRQHVAVTKENLSDQ